MGLPWGRSAQGWWVWGVWMGRQIVHIITWSVWETVVARTWGFDPARKKQTKTDLIRFITEVRFHHRAGGNQTGQAALVKDALPGAEGRRVLGAWAWVGAWGISLSLSSYMVPWPSEMRLAVG